MKLKVPQGKWLLRNTRFLCTLGYKSFRSTFGWHCLMSSSSLWSILRVHFPSGWIWHFAVLFLIDGNLSPACVITNPRKTLPFLVFVYFFMEQSKSPVPPANRPNLRPFFLARPQFSLPAFTHASTSYNDGQRLLITGIIINFGAS